MKIIVSLRISIFILFFAVTTAILAVASVYSLHQIINIQVVTAAETMQTLGEKIRERVTLVYQRMESTLAAFERADGRNISGDFDNNPWFGTFINMMDLDRDIYSSYFGLSDGRFYQVIDIRSFNISGSKFKFPIPDDAAYAELRQFPDTSGKMIRIWTFYSAERKKISMLKQDSTDYDPRTRIWYKSAFYTSERSLSRPYNFYMINNYGITLSSRLKNGMDGVFGADITVGSLSRFLEKEKLTENTRMLVYNESDIILGLSVKTGEDEEYKNGSSVKLMSIYDITDDAVARYAAKTDRRLENNLITFSSGNEKYIAKTVKIFDDQRGAEYAAVIIPLKDILGGIYSLHYKIMFFVAILALCSIPVISFAATRISNPLERIIQSMNKIRELDTSPESFEKSGIKEINELNDSVCAMTDALDRYTTYVPKDTVKEVIKSGQSTEIGAQTKYLSLGTIHIKNFDTLRNSMDSDRLFRNLSDFYSSIESRISHNSGHIDNFSEGIINVYWNAPKPMENHEISAALCALECCYLMNRSRLPYMTDDGKRITVNIALNSGDMAVGNLGTKEKLIYTVCGKPKDTLEMLSDLNSIFNTHVLATGSIVQKLPDNIVRRWVDTVDILGKNEEIYELVGLTEGTYPDTESSRLSDIDIDYFAKFHEIKHRLDSGNYDDAKALLTECIAERPDDLTAIYMKKHLNG